MKKHTLHSRVIPGMISVLKGRGIVKRLEELLPSGAGVDIEDMIVIGTFFLKKLVFDYVDQTTPEGALKAVLEQSNVVTGLEVLHMKTGITSNITEGDKVVVSKLENPREIGLLGGNKKCDNISSCIVKRIQ